MNKTYEDFFGFKLPPFSMSSALYVETKVHRRTYIHMKFALKKGEGIVVLTGNIGTGKTTLVKKLLNECPEIPSVFASDVLLNTEHLFKHIARRLNIKNRGDVFDVIEDIYDYAVELAKNGKHLVCVVDEAQTLGREGLEKLRLFSNFEYQDRFPIQLVLVGQISLKQTISEMPQLLQRVLVFCELTPLNRDETISYVRQRLLRAGGRGDIFTEQALDVLWRISKGVPRLINKVADMSLTYAYADGKRQITAEIVKDVEKEMSKILV